MAQVSRFLPIKPTEGLRSIVWNCAEDPWRQLFLCIQLTPLHAGDIKGIAQGRASVVEPPALSLGESGRPSPQSVERSGSHSVSVSGASSQGKQEAGAPGQPPALRALLC